MPWRQMLKWQIMNKVPPKNKRAKHSAGSDFYISAEQICPTTTEDSAEKQLHSRSRQTFKSSQTNKRHKSHACHRKIKGGMSVSGGAKGVPQKAAELN